MFRAKDGQQTHWEVGWGSTLRRRSRPRSRLLDWREQSLRAWAGVLAATSWPRDHRQGDALLIVVVLLDEMRAPATGCGGFDAGRHERAIPRDGAAAAQPRGPTTSGLPSWPALLCCPPLPVQTLLVGKPRHLPELPAITMSSEPKRWSHQPLYR